MKARFLQFGLVVVLASLLVLAFLTVTALAAPGRGSATYATIVTNDVSAQLARRRISIPFGIDSPLRLSEDGQSATVTGPAGCPEEGSYDLRVMLTQHDAKGIAKGETSGACSQDTGAWQTEARALGSLQLSQGEAQACAVVVVHLAKGATTKRWCKSVTLTSSP